MNSAPKIQIHMSVHLILKRSRCGINREDNFLKEILFFRKKKLDKGSVLISCSVLEYFTHMLCDIVFCFSNNPPHLPLIKKTHPTTHPPPKKKPPYFFQLSQFIIES